MELNRELLEQRKKIYEGELEKARDQANAIQGALQDVKHWLEVLNTEAEKKTDETTPPGEPAPS